MVDHTLHFAPKDDHNLHFTLKLEIFLLPLCGIYRCFTKRDSTPNLNPYPLTPTPMYGRIFVISPGGCYCEDFLGLSKTVFLGEKKTANFGLFMIFVSYSLRMSESVRLEILCRYCKNIMA